MSNADLLGLERQERIAHLLEQRGTLTVSEISESFEVSEATVRRDLAALASRNMLRRVHGGAMRIHTVATSEAPIMLRQDQNIEAKRRIGQAAARRVQNGETVLLVGGSTGMAVARELGEHSNLTIVTDSLFIAQELIHQGSHKVIMLGGMIDPAEFAVRGTFLRLILSELQVDKVILGTKAISPDRGLSGESAEEAEISRAYIHAGHHVIVVTDSSKFHQSALVRVVPIDAIDMLITDDGIPPSALAIFQEHGIYVEIV